MKPVRATLYEWLDERLSLGTLLDFARHKTVPVHRYSAIYYFGGMTLFFFLVQVLTGILLMLYYRPTAAEAFESVELLMTSVSFGWLIRSLHSWSANLMIFFAFLHRPGSRLLGVPPALERARPLRDPGRHADPVDDPRRRRVDDAVPARR